MHSRNIAKLLEIVQQLKSYTTTLLLQLKCLHSHYYRLTINVTAQIKFQSNNVQICTDTRDSAQNSHIDQ